MAHTDKGFISPKFRENEAFVRRGHFFGYCLILKNVFRVRNRWETDFRPQKRKKIIFLSIFGPGRRWRGGREQKS